MGGGAFTETEIVEDKELDFKCLHVKYLCEENSGRQLETLA